MGWQI